jgi:hypothetical protein
VSQIAAAGDEVIGTSTAGAADGGPRGRTVSGNGRSYRDDSIELQDAAGGLTSLSLPAVVASVVPILAAPAPAAVTFALDPTGGGGADVRDQVDRRVIGDP